VETGILYSPVADCMVGEHDVENHHRIMNQVRRRLMNLYMHSKRAESGVRYLARFVGWNCGKNHRSLPADDRRDISSENGRNDRA
jgi:hypothetical protein